MEHLLLPIIIFILLNLQIYFVYKLNKLQKQVTDLNNVVSQQLVSKLLQQSQAYQGTDPEWATPLNPKI
tara:strand:+ start:71 stop:277 length:207 start_codon:yes stop_codon:yes gene_type:complete